MFFIGIVVEQSMEKINVRLEDFQRFLLRRRRDESTVAAYTSDVEGYIEFLDGRVEFNADLMIDFINYMSQRGLSSATIQRRVIGVVSFWSFAYHQGIIDQPPVTLADLGVRLQRDGFRTIPLSENDYSILLSEVNSALAEIR
jgi:site-specific recombinase XerD